jgi:1-acyl-sn-glycerol-3-phosphate acyltransferase
VALTAPADERARRRHADLVAALGTGAPALAQVLDDIEARDRKDAAQMDLAADAITVENRDGQLEAVVERICALLAETLQRHHASVTAPAAVTASPPAPAAAAVSPTERRPRAAAREGAYVAPAVTARRDARWDGTAWPLGYAIVRRIAGLLFPLFFKLRVEGLENVPPDGAAILASNHVAWIDIPLVAYPVPRITHYMGKIELFQVPILGWVIGVTGSFPVRRGEGDRESLRIAERLLGEGQLMAIFPEGHRSDGQLIRGLPGVALIAFRANAPVVPVAIINSRQVFRMGHIVIHRPTVTIRYGAPFLLSKRGARHTRDDLERGVDEIMTHIALLLPPDYHGIYAEQAAAMPSAASQPASHAAPPAPTTSNR